jgi:uncharacterized membrane protein
MSLQSWLQNSWLVQRTTSPEEIKNLLAISDRDLLACQVKQLPADWRCTIAYNAALQAATAALAAGGYRAARDNITTVLSNRWSSRLHRAENIDTLDGFRKKRNVSSYDLAGAVSDKEADEMLKLATSLRADAEEWIRATRPGATETQAAGINAADEVVGLYLDASSVEHGFILNGGVYTQLDPPQSTSTIAFGVNDAGTISGSYTDASNNNHGFLYSGGIFNRVDVAGAKGTQLTHIPNKGAFAGYFTDQSSEFHGVTGH